MKLMIVESSGKLEKLGQILAKIRSNENWKVVASLGHIRDLPASGNNDGEVTTGVRNDLTPVYELTEKGAKVVKSLQHAVSQASEVYLASDPDREGESIAWHIKEAIGIRNPIRVSFNEVTEKILDASLSNPRKIDMKLVAAQEARRVADRIIGYMVSSELRRQTGEALSAGRVQSVALYLVVLREREIRLFKPTLHYGARLNFAGAKTGEQWAVEWMTAEGFTTDESPYFMDRAFAKLVANVPVAQVTHFEDSSRKRQPPAPFKTSTLQQAASNDLGWSSDHTMKVAQALFDQGLITYHRTDNPNISEESMGDIRAVAASLGLEVVAKRREFTTTEGAQVGHPATTPTHWEVADAGSTTDEQTLYRMIRIRAIASQLMAAEYAVRTVFMKAVDPVQGKQVLFSGKGEVLMVPGWLKLLAGDSTTDEPEAANLNPIPVLSPGQTVNVQSGEVLEKKTRAPKRYTEASLVGALEAQGIGRPATYAAIMNNIKAREYVKEVKRFFHATERGEMVIDRMEGKFTFLQVSYTRDLEQDLDQIATGQTQYRPVLQGLLNTLKSELGQQLDAVPTYRKPVITHQCPDCQKEDLRLIKGANGAFWACKGYPACGATFPDAGGKPGQRKEVSDYKCTKCQKPLRHNVKKGKTGYNFWGCTGFKEGCKATYPNLKGDKPDFANAKGI